MPYIARLEADAWLFSRWLSSGPSGEGTWVGVYNVDSALVEEAKSEGIDLADYRGKHLVVYYDDWGFEEVLEYEDLNELGEFLIALEEREAQIAEAEEAGDWDKVAELIAAPLS